MLKLRELTEQDESAFLEGAKLWPLDEITWYSFDWKPGVAFHKMLAKLGDNREGRNLPAHFVPSTMLYAFDQDGAIVGRLNIRHGGKLENKIFDSESNETIRRYRIAVS